MNDGWIDSAGLIRLASEHGHEVSLRKLELWRYRGLLPRPQRQPKGRAVWLYPPGTDRQLLRLLHWRARAQALDAVRVALWVEGFPIGLDGVREALQTFVDAALSAVKRALEPAGDRSTTIDQLASRLAAMRSRAPYPRVVRMSMDDRTRAYGYMLALASGDPQELERRTDDGKRLERMIGLRSGHGDGLAHLFPLNDSIGRLLPLISVQDIRAAIASASEEEYELVRWIARTVLLWLPMLLTFMRSSVGAKGVALLDAARQRFHDPPAAIHEEITIAMIVLLQAKAPAREEIRRLMAGVTPATIDAEMLSLIPKTARDEAFKQMEPRQRAHLRDELARWQSTPR